MLDFFKLEVLMRCHNRHKQQTLLVKICENLIWCLMIGLFYGSSFAQTFDHLSTFHIKGYFAYAIRFDSTWTRVLNERIDDERGGCLTVKAIVTRLSNTSKNEYLVIFCEGISVDPFFEIYRIVGEKQEIDSSFQIYAITNEAKRKIGGISGLEIVIPGNGNVYVYGHTNNMFNMRRKFTLKDDQLEEIKQPFYYVGLVSKTTQSVNLFSDISSKEKVAQLPAGYEVEVLINKGDNYLIKTPFGLTGWISIPFGTMSEQTPIKGIYFAGD